MNTKIYIKNMVCLRCINAVKGVLEDVDIPYSNVHLGVVHLQQPLTIEQSNNIQPKLESLGFSLVSNRKSQLIERMKNLVIDQIHHSRAEMNIKYTDFISDQLNQDYKYLSALFSSVEGITFEQFIIKQKIERIKELIVYDELSLSEIAYQLEYSSVAYLSNQFKKITGMTPTQFKHSTLQNRNTLDGI